MKNKIISYFVIFAFLFETVIISFIIIDKAKRASFPLLYYDEVKEASEKYELEIPLIYAVISCESDFDDKALSSKGAVGLMQIMPSTFEALSSEYPDADIYFPKDNINFGCMYLSLLFHTFDDLNLAIAAYNAGPSNVDKWLDEKKELSIDEIPFEETRKYVIKVLKTINIYKKLYFEEEQNNAGK